MKRVLIITYYWPPTGGSGVQRWLKMSKYLPQFGWQPVIYTPSNPERALVDDSLLNDVPAEAEILTSRIIEPYSLFRMFIGKRRHKTSLGAAAVNPINGEKGKSLKMKLSLWARANLFIPDPRYLWIRPSVRFLLKYLKEHPVDAIVSTGPPHSMHLIARELHRKTGIKWIADFRDPWTKIFYFKHLPLTASNYRKHLRLEKSVFLEADEVVTVTSVIQKDIQDVLPDEVSKRKVHLIENGYDEADFATEVQRDEKFTLLHTGVFSAEGNPLKLWKVLKTLCDRDEVFASDMRIELIGKCDKEIVLSIVKAGLEDYLTVKGYQPHHEVNKRQKAAHVLLLPLRTEPESAGILTGKFFEYIAARRPIVAFGPHLSALEDALTETDMGKIFDWEEEQSLEAYIMILYIKYLEDRKKDASVYRKRLCQMFPEDPVKMPQYPVFLDEPILLRSRRAQAKQFTELFRTLS